MRRRLIYFSMALLAGALVTAGAAGAPTPTGGTNDHLLRIGVVHITRILQQMQERKKIEEDFRSRQLQLRQEQQRRQEELAKLVEARKNYKPLSGQWQDATKVIDQKQGELEAWARVSALQLDRERKVQMKALYDHIAGATATIAGQQNLDLVLANNEPEIGPDMDQVTFERLQAALESRNVLFAGKKADVTEEVLTLVEANFAKQAQAGAALINPVGGNK